MRRVWIIGLVFALCIWGGVAVMCLVGLAERHHLNGTGWLILTNSGYIIWITYRYIRQKLAERQSVPLG
jgi:hypothetical protein